MEYFIWAVSLLGLFIGVFWTQVALAPDEEKKGDKLEPTVSFIVPAWNEEKTLRKTIESILNLYYPKEKIQILIINDGSTDRTKEVANHLISENPLWDIELINRTRTPEQCTKAPALNEGLKAATGKYIACLDSDSRIEADSLNKIFEMFDEEKVASVISAIKVSNPITIFSKIQRIEYILATFLRKLMSKVDTLHITPGALSIYKTKIIKNLGGFDEKNITEDYEIAMRLRYNGYKIKIQPESISYTNVPVSFKGMWDQRVRWFRGFIMTSIKYKNMFANKKFGMMGVFQYPINIISFVIIILTFLLLAYESTMWVYRLINKLLILGSGIIEIIKIPTLKDILLHINIKVIFPIIISLSVIIFIYYLAHKSQKEKWKHPLALVVYFTIYPTLRTAHWVTATYKELFKRNRKW